MALLKVRAVARRHPFALTAQPAAGKDPAAALKRKREVYFKELGGYTETACYDEKILRPGNVVTGPAIIEEAKTTLVVPPDCEVTVDVFQNYRATLPST